MINRLTALGDKIGIARDLVHDLSQIDEKRLKLYGQLLDKINTIAQSQGAQGPQTLQNVAEIVRILNGTPVEKITEIRALVGDLERLSKTMPKELLALAQAAMSK